MTDTVSMPPEAAEFIRSLSRSTSRRWRWMRRCLLAAALIQLACWWLIVPFPKPDVLLGRIAASVLFPATPMLLIFWLTFRWRPANLARDAACTQLQVASGQYVRCWCSGSKHPDGEQGIKVEGVRVLIPLSLWLTLPKRGTIAVEYFPHSRLCWRINEQPAWKR
jgi:hypothetical protein